MLSNPHIPQFQIEATAVLTEVQSALAALLANIPGGNRRATDLHDQLGIDYKLCWQVVNVARATDALSIYQHVPSEASMKKMLTAARAQGTPEEVLGKVSQAIRQYYELVEVHSNDRQEFDSMLSSLIGGEAASATAIQNRRAAFRYESQIWGMQVRLFLQQMYVRRSANGDGFDEVIVNGKLGLYQLRQNANPVVYGQRPISAGVATGASRVTPLDADAAAAYGTNVLPEFSSQPLPQFRETRTADGWIYSSLASHEMGRKGAVNLVFGSYFLNTQPAIDDTGRQVLRYGITCIAPTESAVLEVFVHRDSLGFVNPVFNVYGAAAGTIIPETMRQDWGTAIQHEQSEASPVAGVPRYKELVEYVFKHMGWNPNEFALFRVRMTYPIMHTHSELTFPLSR